MSIRLYGNASGPVRHAAHRLSSYTGIPVAYGAADGPHIVLEIGSGTSPGRQGYMIRGGAPEGRDRRSGERAGSREATTDIHVRSSHDEGLTNGIFTLIRTMMIERIADPFDRNWDVSEAPHFGIRSMIVAPYRFGGSYGYAALSPDRWSLDEWKRYVDLMRLCNMTTLCMGSARMYHPDYPHSEREKWRYEVWKGVMDYCHQVGIRFHWFVAPNIVCEQCFWDNPDLRAVSARANWYGNSLIWGKAKDLILENQRFTLEFFAGLDGLELIFSDGGAFSFDEATGADPAGYFADATRSYIDLMRQVGNDADFVFWNWGLDVWAKVLLPPDEVQKYPKYATMQDDVLELLPRGVQWLDASMLTWAQCYSHLIRARGNPPLREHILLGKENGFAPTIDFFWYMNPELSVNMLPHPSIERGIQEARYARDELGTDGVMGYRLAPPCRFVDDLVFFRLASDPSLGRKDLIAEASALLCQEEDAREEAATAIDALETFWTSHAMDDLERAESAFSRATRGEGSRAEFVRDGVTFLSYVVRLAHLGDDELEAERLRYELYERAKDMYIFQGLVADIACVADALPEFMYKLGRMVEQYARPLARSSPIPDVLDRSIYPEATAEPRRLDFSKTTQSYELDPAEVLRIARLASMRARPSNSADQVR